MPEQRDACQKGAVIDGLSSQHTPCSVSRHKDYIFLQVFIALLAFNNHHSEAGIDNGSGMNYMDCPQAQESWPKTHPVPPHPFPGASSPKAKAVASLRQPFPSKLHLPGTPHPLCERGKGGTSKRFICTAWKSSWLSRSRMRASCRLTMERSAGHCSRCATLACAACSWERMGCVSTSLAPDPCKHLPVPLQIPHLSLALV